MYTTSLDEREERRESVGEVNTQTVCFYCGMQILFLHIRYCALRKKVLKWSSVWLWAMLSCTRSFSSWQKRKNTMQCNVNVTEVLMQYRTCVSLIAPHCQEGAFPLAWWQGKICQFRLIMINNLKPQRKEQRCASHKKEAMCLAERHVLVQLVTTMMLYLFSFASTEQSNH